MWKADEKNRIFINCVLPLVIRTIDTLNPTPNSVTLKDFKFLHFNLHLVRIFQSKRQSKQTFYILCKSESKFPYSYLCNINFP